MIANKIALWAQNVLLPREPDVSFPISFSGLPSVLSAETFKHRTSKKLLHIIFSKSWPLFPNSQVSHLFTDSKTSPEGQFLPKDNSIWMLDLYLQQLEVSIWSSNVILSHIWLTVFSMLTSIRIVLLLNCFMWIINIPFILGKAKFFIYVMCSHNIQAGRLWREQA